MEKFAKRLKSEIIGKLMNTWQDLNQETQIKEISDASFKKPQLIFKHSTTCGISAHAQHRLATATRELGEAADLHYLDLLRYRPISDYLSLINDISVTSFNSANHIWLHMSTLICKGCSASGLSGLRSVLAGGSI